MSMASNATFVETVSGTTHDLTFSLVAGTNRKLSVIAFVENSGTGNSGITFDGTSMGAAVVSITNPGDSAERMYLYQYDVPDAKADGSYTIRWTTTTSVSDITMHAWQHNDRATGAAEYAQSTTADNTVTSISDTGVTCTDGADVIAVASTGSATPTWTWAGGTVSERTENNETNYTTCSADAAAVTAGTKTVTATASSSAGFKNMIVSSIAAASAPAPSPSSPPYVAPLPQRNVRHSGRYR